MRAVRHARRKDQDLFPVLRQLDDFPACADDKALIVHERLDLVREELAAADMQPFKIRLVFPVFAFQLREPARDDQFAHADFAADFIQDVFLPADQPSFQPVRRSCHPDQPDVRIDLFQGLKAGAVHPVAVRRDQMRFVDQHKIEASERLGAFVNRLDSSDNDVSFRLVRIQPRGINADPDLRTERRDFRGVLLEELFHVRENQAASAPSRDRVRDDPRDHDAFSRAGRKHDAWIFIGSAQKVIDLIDCDLLIGAELHFSAPPG